MHRFLITLSVLCALSAPALAAPDANQVARYLDGEYMPDAWPQLADSLERGILSNVQESLDEELGCRLVEAQSTLAMTRLPSVEASGEDTLVMRLPALQASPPSTMTNYNRAKLELRDCDYLVGSVTGWVWWSATVTITGTSADVSVDVRAVQASGAWENTLLMFLRKRVTRGIRESLGGSILGLAQLRFQPEIGTDVPERQLVGHSSYLSRSEALELDAAQAFDVHLMADGFTPSNVELFHEIADQIGNDLAREGGPELEPYASFARTIRVWKTPLVIDAGFDELRRNHRERAMTTRRISGAPIAMPRNLAAVYRARPQQDDVTIFIGEGVGLGVNLLTAVTSMTALGRTVNLAAVPRSQSAPATARKGIALTSIGGLADELAIADMNFFGPEPTAPNVSLSPNSSKWNHWADLIEPTEGALGIQRGVFRPTPSSLLNSGAAVVPMGPVAREAVTIGMRERLEQPFVLLGWRVSDPLRARRNSALLSSALGYDLPLQVELGLAGATIYETDVELEVKATNLPRPWRVQWRVRRGNVGESQLGEETTLHLRPGDEVTLSIRSESDFIRLEGYESPEITVPIGTYALFDFPGGSPAEPTDLDAAVDVSSAYDPATGCAVSRRENGRIAQIGADPECFGMSWSLECRNEYRLIGDNEVTRDYRTRPLQWQQNDMDQAYLPVGYLPGGTYTFEARSSFLAPEWGVSRTRNSDWVTGPDTISVAPLSYAVEPHEPAVPNGLRAYTCGDEARLSAVSWDLNREIYEVEIEWKPANVPLDGTGRVLAGLFIHPAEPAACLGTRAEVTVKPPREGWYHFRARALNDAGDPGPWSTERRFYTGGQDSCRAESVLLRLETDPGRFFGEFANLRDLMERLEEGPNPRGGEPIPCPDCFDDSLFALIDDPMVASIVTGRLAELGLKPAADTVINKGKYQGVLDLAGTANFVVLAERNPKDPAVHLTLVDRSTGAEWRASGKGTGKHPDSVLRSATKAAAQGLVAKLKIADKNELISRFY